MKGITKEAIRTLGESKRAEAWIKLRTKPEDSYQERFEKNSVES